MNKKGTMWGSIPSVAYSPPIIWSTLRGEFLFGGNLKSQASFLYSSHSVNISNGVFRKMIFLKMHMNEIKDMKNYFVEPFPIALWGSCTPYKTIKWQLEKFRNEQLNYRMRLAKKSMRVAEMIFNEEIVGNLLCMVEIFLVEKSYAWNCVLYKSDWIYSKLLHVLTKYCYYEEHTESQTNRSKNIHCMKYGEVIE